MATSSSCGSLIDAHPKKSESTEEILESKIGVAFHGDLDYDIVGIDEATQALEALYKESFASEIQRIRKEIKAEMQELYNQRMELDELPDGVDPTCYRLVRNAQRTRAGINKKEEK